MTLLPTSFLPNTLYLSLIAKRVVKGISVYENYEKQTYRNRADFFDANGPIAFTIPVQKIGYPSPVVSEVLISEHGNWRDRLWQLLSSSYHSTPYWEYYLNDIKKRIYDPTPKLIDYNHRWLEMLCCLIGLDTPPLLSEPGEVFTQAIDPKFIELLPTATRYWQVFEHKHGFQPYLSSLDMLLNLGPESRLILCEDAHNA